MPNTSNNPHTVEQFQLSKTFQSNAYIKEFTAILNRGYYLNYWTVYIVTTHNQVANITDPSGSLKQFLSLDDVASYLSLQGVDKFTASLFSLNIGGSAC